MAAEIVGGAFLSSVYRLASSDFLRHFRKRKRDYHDDGKRLLEQLKTKLKVLEVVLDDAEKQQITKKSVKDWVDNLKDVVYQADDLVDEIETKVLRFQTEAAYQSRASQQVRVSTCDGLFDAEMVSKIQEILDRLEDLAKESKALDLKVSGVLSEKRWPTTSLVIGHSECDVWGRDDDREKIIDLLLSQASGNEIDVIPIVGMGGLRKTTLAQLVYNDARVVDHFDTKSWACVPDDFDVVEVTRTILEEVSPSNYSDTNNLNRLQVELKKSLKGRKFLIVFPTGFIRDWEEKCNKHEALKTLLTQITDVVCKEEDTVGLSVVDTVIYNSGIAQNIGHALEPSLNLGDVIKEIKGIKRQLLGIYDIGDVEVGQSSNDQASSRTNIDPTGEEDKIIGFDCVTTNIKDRLVGGQSQLDVISIIGMAGQGKTTLARNIYEDPLTRYHFHIRAWITVSHKYLKRDLLLGILSSIMLQHTNEIYEMSDETLGEQLYKRLKGKRYLIVMDDMWDKMLWNDFKRYFPNDNNGSRIMITSRLTEMALNARSNNPPYFLHFLNEDESWDLLQLKVFRGGETCPPKLMEVGKQIAKKCQGLPLAIVVIAGILAKKEKNQDWWKQVAETLSSYVVGDPQKQCLQTLELSFNHLPHHLKPCFLYFGAFPEDFEIPVQNLIWLWVAEGFIRQIGQKSVEDTAEEYLMDLIDRSLVLISKRRSDGGVKSCRIHDLLRDFCLRKASNSYFLQQISSNQHAAYSLKSFSTSSYTLPPEQMQFRFLVSNQHLMLPGMPFLPNANMRRLCVHADILHRIYLYPSALNIRSFLCLASRHTKLPHGPTQFIYRAFKILRVLDISLIPIHLYPSDIEELVHLRYLALSVSFNSLPESISNLRNLETLILSMYEFVILPSSIWRMVKLRHLSTNGEGFYKIELPHSFEEIARDGCYPALLDSLLTIKRLYPRSCEDFLAGTPNLGALAFKGPMLSGSCLTFPELHHLNHLHKLKLFNTLRPSVSHGMINLQRVKFPPNLKKLTLEKTYLNWEEMSTLGLLPNLEILKLFSDAFVGSTWNARDGEFRHLKYLRLQSLDIVAWYASCNHFPKLQQLVVVGCRLLMELPSGLVDIPTLQMIEVRSCSYFAQLSATKIKEEQESMGNTWLKIIDHLYED